MTRRPIDPTVARNVRSRMYGRTQTQLADFMGLTKAWASAFLAGKSGANINLLDKLAAFCHCSKEDLIQPVATGTKSATGVLSLARPQRKRSDDSENRALLNQLRTENESLRKAINAIGQRLVSLAETGRETRRPSGTRRSTRRSG